MRDSFTGATKRTDTHPSQGVPVYLRAAMLTYRLVGDADRQSQRREGAHSGSFWTF
jgi:hypothetical protein